MILLVKSLFFLSELKLDIFVLIDRIKDNRNISYFSHKN